MASTVALTDLVDGEARGAIIAVLGGGGKTTLIEMLATEFAQEYDRVLVSSLTKTLGRLSKGALTRYEALRHGVAGAASQSNPVRVLGPLDEEGKATGIAPDDLAHLVTQAEITIFECDGARNLPLKVHTDRDPDVPPFTTLALIVVGGEVVGTTLNEGLVHRPELFAKRWGVGSAEKLSAERIAGIVTHPDGYVSKVPDGIKIAWFVNKADQAEESAKALANEIAARGKWPVHYGSLHRQWYGRIQ